MTNENEDLSLENIFCVFFFVFFLRLEASVLLIPHYTKN